jgi:hypothetical protein
MFNVRKSVMLNVLIFLFSLFYCNSPAKADFMQELKDNVDNVILNIIDNPILGRNELSNFLIKTTSQVANKSGDVQIGGLFMCSALIQVGIMTNQELYKITKKAVYNDGVNFFEEKKKLFVDTFAKKEIVPGVHLSETMSNGFKKGAELFKQSKIGSKLLAGKLS